MITRSFILPGLFGVMFCAVVATIGCASAEQRRHEAFQALWKSVRTYPEIREKGPAFRSYYPEIVSNLSVKTMDKTLAIFLACGDPWPAAELAPLLEGAEGEQRVVLASLVASFSGGYHEASVKLVKDALPDAKEPLREFLDSMLFDATERRNAGFEVFEAVCCDVPLHQWEAMTYAQRWKRMCEVAKSCPEDLAGKTTGLRDDYQRIVEELKFENWWMLARAIRPDWEPAIMLEPYLSKVSGDKRVLLAILVAMGSYGHSPRAMGILKDVPDGVSDEVARLAGAMVSALEGIRKRYSAWALGHRGIIYEGKGKWKEMSVDERWQGVKAYYLKLEKRTNPVKRTTEFLRPI